MPALRPTHRRMSAVQRAVAIALLILSAGCTSTRTFTWPWQKEKIVTADAKNPVHRIVCMWEPSEGRRPDGMPARGFAGQILFFTRTSSAPVRVEGDVKVYVFDDHGPNGNPTLPISEFDFVRSPDGDAWNRHLTITTLGPSYNVFIPYMRPGHEQARCAVQLRLVSDVDAPLFSDVATIVLPGPAESPHTDDVLPTAAPAPTRTVSHYVDGPAGRQPVGVATQSAVTQAVSPMETPAIGTVVKTQRGVSVASPRVQPNSYAPHGSQAPLVATPPRPAAPGSTMSASEADRLARIEQMLEQLAAQQRMTHGAGGSPDNAAIGQSISDADRFAVAGQPASPRDSHTVAPASYSLQPANAQVAFPEDAASGDVPSWSGPHSPAGPTGSAGTTNSYRPAPAIPEPGRLDGERLDRHARRLTPRPSWFDQASRPQPQTSGTQHPLRDPGTGSWGGQGF